MQKKHYQFIKKYRMKKKYSIIIVSLNTKNHFIETLNSIIRQTYKNYEIIVVDGFSTDGTRDEILKNKKKISKIIIEKDKGIYDAMNKGLKKASGKWVIFMNSGDIFVSKNTINLINSRLNWSYDIVYGDTIIRTKDFNFLKRSSKFYNNTVVMPFSHQSTVVKLNILKKRKFNINYKFSSDFDFFYDSYLKEKKFKKINKVFSKVRSKGSSDLNRLNVLSENINILKKYNSGFLMLYFHIIYYLITSLLKLILPEKIEIFILKLKYKNMII